MSRIFDQVIASTKQQMRTVPTLTERQARRRRLTSCLAFIRPRDLPQAGYRPANVLDVSDGGIGLLLDDPLPLEAALEMTFRHLAIRDRVAMVVRVKERDAGWHIGCKLSDPFSLIELRALGAFET